jgi:ubiquitin-protein ligase
VHYKREKLLFRITAANDNQETEHRMKVLDVIQLEMKSRERRLSNITTGHYRHYFLPILLLFVSLPRNAVSKQKQPNKISRSSKIQSPSTTTTTGPITSPASSSLRRIRKEYKDAVSMGIAYDWTNQKRIRPSSKKMKKNLAKTYDENKNNNQIRLEDPCVSKMFCLGPLTTNLRHWHFSFRGSGDVFGKGIYHGRIVLPKDYPLTPPRVQLWTPSGRFKPGVDICLSASSYHPESWTAKWTIFGLVNALRLHMLRPPLEIGSMTSTIDEMEEYARKSQTFRAQWYSGDKEIIVSHAKLLQEGILSLDEEVDRKDVSVPEALGEEMEEPVDCPVLNDRDDGVAFSEKKIFSTAKTKRKKAFLDITGREKGQKYSVHRMEKQPIHQRIHVVILTISKVVTSPQILLLSLVVLLLLYTR